ncbi:LPXTG cell wall anchor domain-containing protein [Ligilactobacillus salivarius]|nr:LPXTG cell wall anchor domain-containing protein [Ligilactobacillus salivarius]
MANTVKQENAKALPQTGDKQNNNTTVGAILVGLGSLLGLGALGKRKED